MAFELFTQKSIRRDPSPRVSISKAGTLQLNGPCINGELVGCDHVQLLYDADTGAIAIRRAAETDPHTYKLCRNREQGGYVSGTAFLKSHGIPYTKTTPYDAAWRDDLEAYVFNPPKPARGKPPIPAN